jgi:hypothetical protein
VPPLDCATDLSSAARFAALTAHMTSSSASMRPKDFRSESIASLPVSMYLSQIFVIDSAAAS